MLLSTVFVLGGEGIFLGLVSHKGHKTTNKQNSIVSLTPGLSIIINRPSLRDLRPCDTTTFGRGRGHVDLNWAPILGLSDVTSVRVWREC